jgi:peptidoglycan/LPS O-acetylase OafA/YrhL
MTRHTKLPEEIRYRGHIAELDGLRALAVILVLLYHFGPHASVGSLLWKIGSIGWIGVDLFFVLSGFLITGILLDTREERLYYKNFYLRRTLRVFPLYYVVIVIGLAIQIAWHNESIIHNIYESSWYSVYLGNIYIAFKNHGPLAGFLGPLWSLQIEEQFYLIFPFLVRKLRPKALFWMLVCVVVLSGPLRWSLYLLSPHRELLQYAALPCRMDGLALGALLALRVRMSQWRIRPATVALGAAGLLSGLFIYLSWGGYDWSTPRIRTFGYSIVALAFASVVLWVLRFRGGWQASWLRIAPLQYLGKISYGIYLLQALIFVLVRKISTHFGINLFVEGDWHSTTWTNFCLLVAIIVLSASISWYFLERPISRLKDRLSRGYRVARWDKPPSGHELIPAISETAE